jgi:hypothetical protein
VTPVVQLFFRIMTSDLVQRPEGRVFAVSRGATRCERLTRDAGWTQLGPADIVRKLIRFGVEAVDTR